MSKSSKAQGLFVILLLFANLAMAQMACISDCSHPDTRRLCKHCVKENNIKRQNNLDAGKRQEQSYRESRAAKDGFNADSSLFTDKRDGIIYRVIKHPKTNRFWMAENLAYAGHEYNALGKINVGKGATVGKGRIYNGDEAKKACPEGWNIPLKDDWVSFTIETSKFASARLKSKTGWGVDRVDTLYDNRGNGYLNIRKVNGDDIYGMMVEPVKGCGFHASKACFFANEISMEDPYRRTTLINLSIDETERGYYTARAAHDASIRCIYKELNAEQSFRRPQEVREPQEDYRSKEEIQYSINEEWIEEQYFRWQQNRPFKTGFNADSTLFVDKRDSISYRIIRHPKTKKLWLAENLAYSGHEYNALGKINVGWPAYRGKGRIYDNGEYKKVCPAGWKLPSQKDWQTFLGNKRSGSYVVTGLKSKTGWGIDRVDTLFDNKGNRTLRYHKVNGDDTFGMTMEKYQWQKDGNIGHVWPTSSVSAEGPVYLILHLDNDEGGFRYINRAAPVRCIYGK